MSYLEDWSHIEKHHSSALSAAIKALKASTLRLPVVDGAKVGNRLCRSSYVVGFDMHKIIVAYLCAG
jgi:hypothetical protein